MKKLFVICSWALLLGGCKSESGASDPDGDKPVPPPSAELLQKIEDLNAGLVSLKTLAGAVSQSEVRSLAETEDGVRLTFCDGTEVTVACNAAAEAPLIGIAVDGDAYYWTLAAEKDIPWLKDAAGAKMPVSGPVPVVGRDDIGTTAGGTDAYGMYYQWGRKDPFYGGEKTETSANAFLEAKNGTVVNPAYPALDWAFSKSATTTDGAAANPMTFYNDKVGTGYNWLASPNATLWGEAKTLNDPCPPGYRVPETGAWEDLISGRQYIDGVSVWDGTNYGMTYTHGEQTAWYPAQGYRNYSSGAIVGLRSSTGGSGAYWSAETSSVKSYYLFFRSKLSSSGSINNELDMNRSYGYTVRCCKE